MIFNFLLSSFNDVISTHLHLKLCNIFFVLLKFFLNNYWFFDHEKSFHLTKSFDFFIFFIQYLFNFSLFLIVLDDKIFCEFVWQFLFEFDLFKNFDRQHNLVFHFEQFEFDFFINLFVCNFSTRVNCLINFFCNVFQFWIRFFAIEMFFFLDVQFVKKNWMINYQNLEKWKFCKNMFHVVVYKLNH